MDVFYQVDNSDPSYPIIILNPKSHWDKYQCICDGGVDGSDFDEVRTAMVDFNCYEDSTSMYDLSIPLDVLIRNMKERNINLIPKIMIDKNGYLVPDAR